MKFGLVLTGFFLLLLASLINQTEAQQTEQEEISVIFVQTTVRNSDGQLIAYLESTKFTTLNLEILGPFLDFEASRGNDPIVTINGEEYQVIRRVQTKVFESNDLVASTNLFNNVNGELVHIARFAHDGYPVTAGDTLESMWTFIRPVS